MYVSVAFLSIICFHLPTIFLDSILHLIDNFQPPLASIIINFPFKSILYNLKHT